MDERILSCSDARHSTESVCIHTTQVYDSCRDKECLEDLRVYFTECNQSIIDRATNVKVVKAEVIWVFSDVEQVPFNRGYYTIDLRFYFKVLLNVFTGGPRPTQVEGLASFDKKVVLFGSDGNAKIFESKYKEDTFDTQLWKKTNMPKAVVEVVDPIALSAKLVEHNHCCCKNDDAEIDFALVPECVHRIFDEGLVLGGDRKRVYVTLGLFSIIKLEREVQLLIPAIDFCIPTKECTVATDSNPCDLFEKLTFPLDEFFPPRKCDFDNLEPKLDQCCKD